MLRCVCVFFALILFLPACTTLPSGPRLSQADVRRIADVESRPKVDLRRYEISGLHYIPNGTYWSVTYRCRTDYRVIVKIRVSDKTGKASPDRNNNGIFEGSLTEKPDYH
jgi:hypothetical protein